MKSKTFAAVGTLAWSLVVCAQPTPSIPKTWDKAALEAMQVRLADPRGTPVQVRWSTTTEFRSALFSRPIPYICLTGSSRPTKTG